MKPSNPEYMLDALIFRSAVSCFRVWPHGSCWKLICTFSIIFFLLSEAEHPSAQKTSIRSPEPTEQFLKDKRNKLSTQLIFYFYQHSVSLPFWQNTWLFMQYVLNITKVITKKVERLYFTAKLKILVQGPNKNIK